MFKYLGSGFGVGGPGGLMVFWVISAAFQLLEEGGSGDDVSG